jgi:hypothetical protein
MDLHGQTGVMENDSDKKNDNVHHMENKPKGMSDGIGKLPFVLLTPAT